MFSEKLEIYFQKVKAGSILSYPLKRKSVTNLTQERMLYTKNLCQKFNVHWQNDENSFFHFLPA